MATTKFTHRSNTGMIIVLVLAIVIVANVLITLVSHHLRWDLTADKRFTLSDATKKTLRGLPDRVIVNVYISEKFPRGLIPAKRRLEELLAEYKSYAPTGYFTYSFSDPAKAVEPDKYEEFMRDLMSKGIRLHSVRDVSKTGGFQMYDIVFGLTMEFRDHKPVALDADVLQNDTTQEYHLTRGIKNLVSTGSKSVAFLKGDNYRDVMGSEEYRAFVKYLHGVKIPIRAATIRDQKIFPDDVDVLVIVGETRGMSQSDLFAVDQFVMGGGRLLVITEGIEPVNVDRSKLMELRMQGIEWLIPKSSALTRLLDHYGISIQPGIVYDEKNCIIKKELRRRFRTDSQGRKQPVLVLEPIFFPYYVMYGVENYNSDSNITHGLGTTHFITSSPLLLKENPILETTAIPLVKSSTETAYLNKSPITIKAKGMGVDEWRNLKAQQDGKEYVLAAAMKGKFSSYFKGKPVPKPEEKPPDQGKFDPRDPRGRGLPGAQPGGPRRGARGRPTQPSKAAPKLPESTKPAPKKPAPKKPESPKPSPGPEKKPPEPEKQPPKPEKRPEQPEKSSGGASGINEIDIPGGGIAGNPLLAETPEPEQPAPEPPKVPDMPGLPPTPPGAEKPGPTTPKPDAPEKPDKPAVTVPPVLPPGLPQLPGIDNSAEPEKKIVEQSDWTQIAVISDVDFLAGGPRGPHFPPPPGPPRPRADYSWRLVRNIIEWMLDDEGILKIRSRGMQARNLKGDITQGKAMAARIIAIGVVPLLVVFAALGLWGMKRRRRRRLRDEEKDEKEEGRDEDKD